MTPEIIERLRSVVGVVKLDWQEHTDGGEWYSDDDPTNNGLGLYWIKPDNINRGEWALLILGHREDSYPTPDEAKAAAQQDYEARIYSALIPVEPVPTPREAELEVALRPFADAEPILYNDWCPDETPAFYRNVDGFDDASPVTVGDFRRARLALNPTHGKEPKDE